MSFIRNDEIKKQIIIYSILNIIAFLGAMFINIICSLYVVLFCFIVEIVSLYFTKKRYKDIIKSELNVFANILEIIHFWEKGHISFDVTIRNYLNYNKNVVLNLQNVELVH